jgi:uncharacterized protein YprB with RNaseH-like and TPR domain
MTADLVALRAHIAAIAARGPGQARPRRSRPLLDPELRLPANCVEEDTPYGPVIARREWFPEEACNDVAALSTCLGLAPDELRRPLFLDTETTGLSGGTGTVAFLIGLAWRDDDGMRLVQYFLSDYNQEDALLWAVGQALLGVGVLVSYNGRTFDWPLLQTRLVMRRTDPAWPAPPHLDLLTLARRIFKPRLPDCALQTIEQAVLELHREEDLPGTLIPRRYFAWLRSRDREVLEPVFLHNRQDVLSMVVLLARMERVLRGSEELHPLDRYGRARFLEARGFAAEALEDYRRLWAAGLSGMPTPLTIRGAIGLRLARLLRRQGRWCEARGVLEECWHTQAYPYPAAIELAKLLEHQARDLDAARRIVSDALRLLKLAVVSNAAWREDLEQRLRRLDRRLGFDDDDEFALTG